MRKTIIAAGLAALVAGGLASRAMAGGDPAAKCASAKQKASGKKAAAKFGCYSKAASKALQVDQACLTKAEDTFTAAFTKADSNGACVGDAAAVEAAVDGCISNVTGQITDTGKCPGAKLKAAGKKAAGKLGCLAKATAKKIPLDQTCLQKATDKFTAAFTKADAAGACSGDVNMVEQAIDGGCFAGVLNEFPICGDGNIEHGETCDDGNTVDESDASVPPSPSDTCPKTCHIDACGPGTTTALSASVNFTAPANVFGLTVFLDYPDAKVAITGSGGGVTGSISNTPPGALSSPNDLDYGLLEGVVSGSAIPPGRLFTVAFQQCPGVTVAVGDFACFVKDASDDQGNPVPGVTCTVSIP